MCGFHTRKERKYWGKLPPGLMARRIKKHPKWFPLGDRAEILFVCVKNLWRQIKAEKQIELVHSRRGWEPVC